VSPVEYAGGKRSLRASITVCHQIHCNPSSLCMSQRVQCMSVCLSVYVCTKCCCDCCRYSFAEVC